MREVLDRLEEQRRPQDFSAVSRRYFDRETYIYKRSLLSSRGLFNIPLDEVEHTDLLSPDEKRRLVQADAVVRKWADAVHGETLAGGMLSGPLC